jgi:predicted amidophosphoribosyltransferase
VTIELAGNWKKGVAFDLHTVESVRAGVNEFGQADFDTTRSDMGQLVYQFKYRGDPSCLRRIVTLLDDIEWLRTMDCIVPIPATDPSRTPQVVVEIAEALGKRHNIRVLADLLSNESGGRELKNVDNKRERRRLLRKHMAISAEHDISGMNVLLVDDVYRSGATLSAATELLLDDGRVGDVYVLTMTKTRSRK